MIIGVNVSIAEAKNRLPVLIRAFEPRTGHGIPAAGDSARRWRGFRDGTASSSPDVPYAACTLRASFAIFRIGRDLVPAIAGTAPPLAVSLAAYGLRWLTFRVDEGFVAVRATPLDHRGVVTSQWAGI
jgi:hypothetical protein